MATGTLAGAEPLALTENVCVSSLRLHMSPSQTYLLRMNKTNYEIYISKSKVTTPSPAT